ncbi:MAG: glutamate racemase [Oscillospiraceae bacterium]|nr:glutamate racemase [Oscillospiraceae bacterium]
MQSDYIAIFDSGVGGLSVLRELLKIMPNERYLYFGDSANAPYGSRPTQEVKALTLAAAEKLVARGIKALVIACNTATSAAIADLRARYPQLIVVGIEPALKLAVDTCPQGNIGIMATQVTLREKKFQALSQRVAQNCRLFPIPAPGLVELVESGKADSPEMDALMEKLLSPYRGKLNALVLGCTHYPFAQAAIAKALPGTALFQGGQGTALQTRRRLEQAGLLYDGLGELVLENSLQSEQILALSHHLLEV